MFEISDSRFPSRRVREVVVAALIGLGLGMRSEAQAEEDLPELHRAKSRAEIEVLLAKGVDLGIKDQFGRMVLHVAAERGDREAVEFLLSKGADVDARDGNGNTPLILLLQQHTRPATFDGAGTVKALTARKADLAVDSAGSLPIHLAARSWDEATVAALLDAGADVNARDKRTTGGRYQEDDKVIADTPLMQAVGNRKEVVELLLGRGADPNLKNGLDQTALTIAITEHSELEDHPEIITLLLTHEADPNVRLRNGSTPAHYAAQLGNAPALALLLDRGADSEAKDGVGWTVLDAAAFVGQRATAELLIARKAKLPGGALHAAVMRDDRAAWERLLSEKTDSEAADALGFTPLHWAALLSRKAAVDALLRHGANPNAASARGRTPLHCAARAADPEVLEALLTGKARLEAGDDSGWRALHLAAAKGRVEAIQILLRHEAEVNAAGPHGYTPLNVAVNAKAREVLKAAGGREAPEVRDLPDTWPF